MILGTVAITVLVGCHRNIQRPDLTPQITAVTTAPSAESASVDGPQATRPPRATPYASAMPLPTPELPLVETYVVQAGDTLSGISQAFNVSVADLVRVNGLGSEEAIINVGQTLQVPMDVTRTAPSMILLPDSEVVYSPAYLDFDVATFVRGQGGYLAEFGDEVDGQWTPAVEIVQRVARQYSVGPRVLLALLEHYGGWVTQAQPTSYQPLGPANPYYEQGFLLQLSWAANRLNQGYYGYKQRGAIAVQFVDGSYALLPGGVNAGTAAIQNLLALNSDWDTWQDERRALMDTYHALFGAPFDLAFEPLVAADLAQPVLRLPWETGELFYFTGGPHAAYGSHSAWAALDFAPPDIKGSCYYSEMNLTAAADGVLYLADTGEVYLDLDGDGNLQTGWVLLYLHMVARDDVSHGQQVAAGTPLGYASCEGGIGNSSHLHLARRYNGEWMAAAGPVPMVLSGWQAGEGPAQYEGTLQRNGVTKTACECWDDIANAITGD
jgi:LasA protease